MEPPPGLVSQGGDPLRPWHRWEGAKHARAGWCDRHPVDDDLAPANLDAMPPEQVEEVGGYDAVVLAARCTPAIG